MHTISAGSLFVKTLQESASLTNVSYSRLILIYVNVRHGGCLVNASASECVVHRFDQLRHFLVDEYCKEET
jgi:hypothetical protein